MHINIAISRQCPTDIPPRNGASSSSGPTTIDAKLMRSLPTADRPRLAPPCEQLLRRQSVPPRHRTDRFSARLALGDDLSFLLRAPRPSDGLPP